MRLSSTLISAAIGAFALAGAAHANIIINGNFSTPNVGTGFGDFASIPGWTSNTTDTLEVGYSPIYGLPCVVSPCQNLEVNANTFGSVSQTVTGLIVGRTYDLSWLYGGRNAGGPQALDVSFGGSAVTTDSSNGVTASWTPNSFDIVATSTTETLTFASEVTGGNPTYGNELTGVSLTLVPEPAAWALMIVGFAGLGAAMRARRGSVSLV